MEKFFRLKENNTSVRTEILAGITTFVTMAYIIFVNPGILTGTMAPGAATDAIKHSIFTATCLASFIGTIIMALYAKLPFGQAPGMGLNAFFAFTIMGAMHYSYNEALAAVCISGILFIIITATGLREMIVKSIPMNLRIAISAGIGLFIAFIGLQGAKIITGNPDTLVSLIDFSKFKDAAAQPNIKVAVVALVGLLIIAILSKLKVRGAILIGIFATAIIGIPFHVTDFSPLKQGIVSLPPSLHPTFFKMDFVGLFNGANATTGGSHNLFSAIINCFFIVIAFSLVDLFDTIGTLLGTAKRANMLDKDGNLPNMKKAMMCDAVATTAGSMLGCSTINTYVESGSGISYGGRTGLTALTVAILFLLALFFSPIAAIIPGAATAPALIFVGVLMIAGVKELDFEDMSNAVPAFLTIIMMPLTYSIATGIAFGLISYTVIKLLSGKYKEIHPITYVLAALFLLRFFAVPL